MIKSILLPMKRIVLRALNVLWGISPRFFVRIFGGVWRLRDVANRLQKKGNFKQICGISLKNLVKKYWQSYGSFVGQGAVIVEPPIFPHGPLGVFISNKAYIGQNVVVFQQVTIGSNTLRDSKSKGAPFIEDNVYIGCGAKIIGNVHIGKNARIGANCVVVKDVPANSVTVIRGIESITRDYELDNKSISINEL